MTARLLLLLLVLAAGPVAGEERTLVLPVGGQEVLDAAGVREASVGDPRVADVARTDDDARLIVTGRRAGETDLILWGEDGGEIRYRIRVTGRDLGRFAGEIRELLGDMEGIEVRVVGDRVVLDGTVLTREDRERVQRIAEGFPELLNLVRMDLMAHDELVARQVRRRIGFPTVEVSVVGDRIILRGSVFREEDRRTAEEVASAYLDSVVNLLRVTEPMVEVDVKFVQVARARGRADGHNILESFAVSASAGRSEAGTAYGISADAIVRLRALREEGHARVVAEPFLTVLSGREGTFHSGGERGYRVSGTGAADVRFKKYGLILTVEPQVYSSGEVETRVAIEVSMPSTDTAAGDIAFTTFRTESQLICWPDETIVVAGLLEGIQSEFRSHTPVLGEIPLLRAFFAEEERRSENRELVLLLTPRLPLVREAEGDAASDRVIGGGGRRESGRDAPDRR